MSLNEATAKGDNGTSEAVTPQSLVTQETVQAALTADKGANARLTAWKVVDFTKKGDNYLCVVTSVEVKYDLDGQSSEVVYVMKLNPCRGDAMSEFLNCIIYEKETNFYFSLVPELNAVLKEIGEREINFPKCLHACLDKGKETIFLEDLRARGYKMHDHRRGMDKLHTTLVLKELARLHAASFLLENKSPGEGLKEKYPCLKKSLSDLIAESEELHKVTRDGIVAAQELLTAVGGYERAVAWIDTLLPKLLDVFSEQLECGKPKVVCHGDCWNNNLLFRYNDVGHPEEVMLLDLQLVHYAPPTADLSHFIYTATTGDVRRPNLQAFLECYHNTLTDIMAAGGQETPFGQEQFIRDFKKKILIGAIFGLMAAPTVIMSPDDEKVSSKDADEGIEEMWKKTKAKAMQPLHSNPFLKPRLLSLLDELTESGIIA